MVPDLTLEAIYYSESTDFKMEFMLCGACSVRFLSRQVQERTAFLTSLQKSVTRSRVIVVIGSLNPLDSEYLPTLIARAAGYRMQPVDKAKFGIRSDIEYTLPDAAIPLVSDAGLLGGCVLESKDQAIVMLTNERALRQELVEVLVCPYIKLFARKKTVPDAQVVPPEAPAATPQTQAERTPDVTINETPPEPAETQIPQDAQTPAHEKTAIENAQAEPAEASPQSSTVRPVNPMSEPVATPSTPPQTQAVSAVPAEEKVPVAAPEAATPSVVQSSSPEPELAEETFTVLERPENNWQVPQNLQDFLVMDDGAQASSVSRHKHRGNAIKAIISVVLVAVVLASAYFGYEWVYQPIQCNAVYKNTQELYGQGWEKLPEDMLKKFGRLYQTNDDIIGWLAVPNTGISFPVVTAAKKTSMYYKSHLFEGSVNRFGTPYTLSYIREDSYARNVIIYGKGIKENKMFTDLEKYLTLEQYRTAPTLSFDTVYMENKWKIFSVFQLNEKKKYEYLRSSFFDDSAFLDYLQMLKTASVIETNIDLKDTDELVTLVCQGNIGTTVVVARKVREKESPLVDVTESSINENAVSPESSSSAVQAGAMPSGFKEVSSTVSVDSSAGFADNGSSRFEQQAPMQASSAVVVKPNAPIPSSSSSVQNSTPASSSKSSATTSKLSSVSNKVSSAQQSPAIKLPTLTVVNNFNGQKVSGPANEIVAKILEAEMGSGYRLEALKAQAVAAYSWLLCNGAASGSAPQAPMKTAGARATEAANAVAGQVAVSGGKVAQTYYYAISAGRTANCEDIWSASLSYLRSVDSSVDKNAAGYQTIRKYAAADVAKWAKDSLGVDLTKIADKSNWFKCQYDINNLYVKTVSIGDKAQKGTYLRNSFFTSTRVGSANVLRSSAYTILYDAQEDKFIFTVRGYGHGVGMSQVGANAYAASGWSYEQILKHYYTGISLSMYTA